MFRNLLLKRVKHHQHHLHVKQLSRRFVHTEPSQNEKLSSILLERLTQLDRTLNYQGWHALRWTSLFFLVAGGTFWYFRENVSKGVGDATSEVTRRTLEDQGVKLQASELARGVVYELLNDQRALELSTDFLNSVIRRENTKVAVLHLLEDVLKRKETEDAVRGLISTVLSHPDSALKASEFLSNLVAIPETRQALVTILAGVLAQPTTKDITANFFTDVMASDAFMTASNRLGNDTMHFLFNDEALRAIAVAWCNAVLNDPALQNTAGDAVWAAVKGAFVPWGKRKLAQQPNGGISMNPTSNNNNHNPVVVAGTVPVPQRPQNGSGAEQIVEPLSAEAMILPAESSPSTPMLDLKEIIPSLSSNNLEERAVSPSVT